MLWSPSYSTTGTIINDDLVLR